MHWGKKDGRPHQYDDFVFENRPWVPYLIAAFGFLAAAAVVAAWIKN